MDLFATRHNNKLAEFVSPVPDPREVAVDALSIPWDRRWIYAYPPTALMQRVLHKLMHSDRMSNAAGGSTSALPAVAFNAPRVACGLSTGGAAISATPETTSVRSVPQPSRTGSSVRMELIQRGSPERQFSEAVAHRLCQTVRASIAGIYDCKWRVYEGWCRTELINPLQATLQQSAEFFEFLCSTRKLAPSTIKVTDQL